jgi:hypothetical protein
MVLRTKGNCIKVFAVPYWSTASPQLHGPTAEPNSASKPWYVPVATGTSTAVQLYLVRTLLY